MIEKSIIKVAKISLIKLSIGNSILRGVILATELTIG